MHVELLPTLPAMPGIMLLLLLCWFRQPVRIFTQVACCKRTCFDLERERLEVGPHSCEDIIGLAAWQQPQTSCGLE